MVQDAKASCFLYEIRQMGRLRVLEVEILMIGFYGEADLDDEARKDQVFRELSGSTGMKQNMVGTQDLRKSSSKDPGTLR